MAKKTSIQKRETRHTRIRKSVHGTHNRPRLSVFRSNMQIYAQLINDDNGETIVSESTLAKDLQGEVAKKRRIEAAFIIGQHIAEKAIKKGVKKVIFDRGGYKYHGQIKSLADGARDAGLIF